MAPFCPLKFHHCHFLCGGANWHTDHALFLGRLGGTGCCPFSKSTGNVLKGPAFGLRNPEVGKQEEEHKEDEENYEDIWSTQPLERRKKVNCMVNLNPMMLFIICFFFIFILVFTFWFCSILSNNKELKSPSSFCLDNTFILPCSSHMIRKQFQNTHFKKRFFMLMVVLYCPMFSNNVKFVG